MPSVLDSVSRGDVFETSLSNGDSDVIVVEDTNDTVGRPFITGYVATVEAVRTDDTDRDVVHVPNRRARLRISAKKVSVFVDHIAKARHYGTIDGFGEYDLDADLPDDVADAAKQAIDGLNGSAQPRHAFTAFRPITSITRATFHALR